MSFKNLDLNLLRVFDAVMSEQNLTRAAERLTMTQPAVSNALKRMRMSLHDDLLVRTAHGMRATARAEELWPTVRDALAQFENSIAPPAVDITAIESTFRLAMPDSMAVLLLPSLVGAIKEEAPGVRICTVPLTTREPRPMLSAGDVDIAVGSFPGVLAEIAESRGSAASQIQHCRLYNGKYVCAMRREHPLAAADLSLDAYCEADHLQVSVSGRARSMLDDVLAGLGRKRTILLTVNQYFTAGKVIENSNLLVVLPLHLLGATGMGAMLVWKPLPFLLSELNVDMLWHERAARSPAHSWLRKKILQTVQLSPGHHSAPHSSTL